MSFGERKCVSELPPGKWGTIPHRRHHDRFHGSGQPPTRTLSPTSLTRAIVPGLEVNRDAQPTRPGTEGMMPAGGQGIAPGPRRSARVYAFAVCASGGLLATGPLRSARSRFARRTREFAALPLASMPWASRRWCGPQDAGGHNGPMPVTAPWPAPERPSRSPAEVPCAPAPAASSPPSPGGPCLGGDQSPTSDARRTRPMAMLLHAFAQVFLPLAVTATSHRSAARA